MRIRKGDQIQIIAGKDKGKSGKVLRVIPEKFRIVVEGLNLIKKHMKPKKGGEKGQRVEIPASINISNTMLVCSKCGKLTRIGFKVDKNEKLRICKKCKSEI
ncbi:MAG: 50S ribosomal protein L24 [Parcubacteria group bacterium]|jgi:large subunit ribosomal protein L24